MTVTLQLPNKQYTINKHTWKTALIFSVLFRTYGNGALQPPVTEMNIKTRNIPDKEQVYFFYIHVLMYKLEKTFQTKLKFD